MEIHLFLLSVGKVCGGEEGREERHRIDPQHAGSEGGGASRNPTRKHLQTGGQENHSRCGGRRHHHKRHRQILIVSDEFIRLCYMI